MAHQIADQALVIRDRFGAGAIGDPGRLTDRGIVAHIVDHPHEAVVEHLMGGVEMRLHAGGGGAQGLLRMRAGRVDLGCLLGAEGHGESLSADGLSPHVVACPGGLPQAFAPRG